MATTPDHRIPATASSGVADDHTGFWALGPLLVSTPAGVEPVRGHVATLLGWLLLHAGERCSRSRAQEVLWGERPLADPDGALRTVVWRLRRTLERTAGGHALRGGDGGWRLELGAGALDAHRFERLIDEARRVHQPDRAIQHYGDALALWRDDPYPELADLPEGRAESVRLGELRLDAYENLVELRLRRGEHRDLVPELEAATFELPLRERLWRQLMVALYRAGRQRDALRAYQRCHAVLAEQLGAAPAPETARLEAEILRQEPWLLPPSNAG